MATFKIYKETAVPTTLEPNSIYFIASQANPDYVEIYVTSSTTPVKPRRILNESDIKALVQSSISGLGAITIVSDIAARNALSISNNTFVLVQDATADPTVNNGAALYLWDKAAKTFIKISEYESMDVTVNWSDIAGKPKSTPTEIDTAVQKSHKHENMTQLDKVGEDSQGAFTYGGANPDARLRTTNW